MRNAYGQVPPARNEPVLSYAPGSPERRSVQQGLGELRSTAVDIPLIIGGREIRTGATVPIHPPHERARTLGVYHKASAAEVAQAIDAALKARPAWAAMEWQQRAAVFVKAAELLSGPWRQTLNAATMLGQSKNVFQAEIDSACELIDFWRFNCRFAARIYDEELISPPGVWNRMQHRPLEGFVFAVSPFNFTSIAGNLPTAPALMGNTVVWKPASTAVYSAYFLCRLLAEAGLPDGVINFVPGSGAEVGDPVLACPHFAGLHFTGSSATFQGLWRTIGQNIANYRSYPRIVGETGGKNFIVAHASADVAALVTAIVRGAFEYQGQKCSAASRVYIPENLWAEVKSGLLEDVSRIRMGPVEDFTNFMNAVIDAEAFDRIAAYIEEAKASGQAQIIAGGQYDRKEGYYVEPTVVVAKDPTYRTMREEIFGPMVTVYVYPEARYVETLRLVDQTSPYGLTGSVFAGDRQAIAAATEALENAAGNFYINDKPTGAVVGQQPFGGARASGTNDKAGCYLNLLRWSSPRTIKETFRPPTDFTYPFMKPDR